jgi:hypothetical protein
VSTARSLALAVSWLCWLAFWGALIFEWSHGLALALFALGVPSQVVSVAAALRGDRERDSEY